MAQAICDITTDEINVDVIVEPQADTMLSVANRAGGMEQVFHDETLIGNGNSIDLGVNKDIFVLSDKYNQDKSNLQSQIDINKEDIAANKTNIAQNDASIADLYAKKIDKDQGTNNVGKVLTVGGDGMVVPKASHGGSGIGVVAHDDSLIGAGTDEYPLGVKDKVTITIVEH